MNNAPASSGSSPAGEPSPGFSDPGQLLAQRRANRDKWRELGLNPYGRRVDGLCSLAHAKSLWSESADAAHAAGSKEAGYQDQRKEVTVAGRVMLHRDGGKLIWMKLRDDTGDLQIAVSKADCSETGFAVAKVTDLGDLVSVRGRVMKTKTGEITVWAGDVTPAAKSLVPPPEKHAGLSDIEIRYRQRYVDLWANPETLEVFKLRSRIVSTMREVLTRMGYTEVETPMLQALAGGAAARPFITKMNALDMNLYMRIAPELYLKRLMVGGMPKVFEINRNFRNEGLDKQHNPEFTMLEAYCAYGDVETVMNLTETLIRELARMIGAISGTGAVLPFGDLMIDYASPFVRVTYGTLFEKAMGFAMTDRERCRAKFREAFPKFAAQEAGIDDAAVVNALFEEFAEGTVDKTRPTFITDYPAAISPLTRPKESDPTLADRADLFIAGMEIAPHYTELNDPEVQEAKFREQLRGIDTEKSAEENTFRTMDHDFLRALRVGMPPAGGMGLGVDRLVMLLTNQKTIRDVVLFPLMRPE